MTPTFLTLGEVLLIHRDQIERYGGPRGLRDVAALRSALAVPRSGAHGTYFHPDLFEMAAAYLFHLARNHPFVDGNKRVGAVAALVFLDLNGVSVQLDDSSLVELVVGVAAGEISKAEVAVRLRCAKRPA